MAKDPGKETEKPLEKMTATELRDTAKEIPEITGAHGMNKPELVAAIKKARGIEDDKPKRARGSIRDIKRKIRVLRAQQAEAIEKKDKKLAVICRKRISKLKKKSRRAAA